MLRNGSKPRPGPARKKGLAAALAVVAVALGAAFGTRLGASALAESVAAAADAVAAHAPRAKVTDAASAAEAKSGKFTLVSRDLSGPANTISDDQVFNGSGCKGKNLSPALSWSDPPPGTKSFALMVHDPDAPVEGGFWHWIVYNIPAETTSIPAQAGDPKRGGMPAGAVQARNDFGAPGYGGPCPPPGKPHHYHFRLYALKVTKLELPAGAGAAMIDASVNANKLGEAELVGLYGR